ncbi:DJ-1/PfpI family protein [Methanoregula sp.]|uniref:DJ-1/PfpI family protein n=1 Tax=Methanoregula sp. TaxID=2052170 RepID=UPI002D153706|nr:DJ-1/PfpI family protein [Methanoregula sp.]HVP96850.1 DJ-1/PfpI family protein [Methanoregula sp.]
MKVVIAVAPEKYRDEELAEPVAALTKAGIGFDIASTRAGPCTGMMGGRTVAGLSFEDIDPKDYHGLIIIGGSGSQTYLWEDDMLIRLATYFHETGKVVGAICLAPVVLARAGILRQKKATVYDSPAAVMEMKKGKAVVVKEPVVTDSRIITANGPPAAKDFAAAVIKELKDEFW